MDATITSRGGRAPPGQNTRMPCARSRSLASAPGSRDPNPSPAHVLTCSAPLVCQNRAPSHAPNGVATPPCTRSWQQSRRSPPTVMNTHAGAPPPSAPHAPELPLNTALMFPLPHPLKLWGLRESRGGSQTVNPGFVTDPRPFWEVTAAGFRDLIDTNLNGYFLV